MSWFFLPSFALTPVSELHKQIESNLESIKEFKYIQNLISLLRDLFSNYGTFFQLWDCDFKTYMRLLKFQRSSSKLLRGSIDILWMVPSSLVHKKTYVGISAKNLQLKVSKTGIYFSHLSAARTQVLVFPITETGNGEKKNCFFFIVFTL